MPDSSRGNCQLFNFIVSTSTVPDIPLKKNAPEAPEIQHPKVEPKLVKQDEPPTRNIAIKPCVKLSLKEVGKQAPEKTDSHDQKSTSGGESFSNIIAIDEEEDKAFVHIDPISSGTSEKSAKKEDSKEIEEVLAVKHKKEDYSSSSSNSLRPGPNEFKRSLVKSSCSPSPIATEEHQPINTKKKPSGVTAHLKNATNSVSYDSKNPYNAEHTTTTVVVKTRPLTQRSNTSITSRCKLTTTSTTSNLLRQTSTYCGKLKNGSERQGFKTRNSGETYRNLRQSGARTTSHSKDRTGPLSSRATPAAFNLAVIKEESANKGRKLLQEKPKCQVEAEEEENNENSVCEEGIDECIKRPITS